MIKQSISAGLVWVVFLSSAVMADTYAIQIPSVETKLLAAKSQFATKTQTMARQTLLSPQSRLHVLAPFGGSKVTPILELNASSLTLLGWERPGTIEEILAAFRDHRTDLKAALQSAMEGGAMSTSTVLSVSVSAQILGRIYLEFGVKDVDISFYVERNNPGSDRDLLAKWSGSHVENSDEPLLTDFAFYWNGALRHLVFVSWRISGDNHIGRDPLPSSLLNSMMTKGYDWAYISADGLGFFSKAAASATKANRSLLSLLRPGGLVILDYPQHAAYNTPDGDAEFTWMAGRAPLEQWGLKQLWSIPLTEPVFGYSGLAQGDSVKVYQKQDCFIGSQDRDITLGNLRQIGLTHNFIMRAE